MQGLRPWKPRWQPFGGGHQVNHVAPHRDSLNPRS